MSEQADSLKRYLSERFSESLDISDEDIEELLEDLTEWNIQDISKFDKHFLYASKWEEVLLMLPLRSTQRCTLYPKRRSTMTSSQHLTMMSISSISMVTGSRHD